MVKLTSHPHHNITVSADPAASILLRFEKLLDHQSQICDELEAIADALPDTIDVQSCLRTAQKLLPAIKTAHDFEESVLFPLINTRTHAGVKLELTIDRLRYEHWGDEEYAAEIQHALREFIRKRDKANIDSLAWMLRGFFDGMRRHIAFDRELLLPMIEELGFAQKPIAH
jgi:hypothetical protein